MEFKDFFEFSMAKELGMATSSKPFKSTVLKTKHGFDMRGGKRKKPFSKDIVPSLTIPNMGLMLKPVKKFGRYTNPLAPGEFRFKQVELPSQRLKK